MTAPLPLRVCDIDRWDPMAVSAVAEAATGWAESATAASAVLAGVIDVVGEGVAATRAREAVERTRAELDSHAAEARAVATAAAPAAERIAAVKAGLRAVEADAHAARLDIDRIGGMVTPARSPAAAALQARLDRLIADADALDADLARALAAAGLPPPMAPAEPAVPPSGSPAASVKRWWESLGQVERDRLLATRPEALGNLDGIPVADRDRANRAVLAGDLAGGDAAAEVREALELNSLRTGVEVLLLLYQPHAFGGQGRAAIALGDPDAAAHTAVVVPGTANSVASGWLDDVAVSDLFNEMTAAAGPAEPTSVVAWMGYDAPDSLLDPRVALTGLARHGGALLAGDVRALAVTAERDSHTTVVGHSYGSTAVADAAAGYGMPADDVVLLGSPGTDMAATAGDFALPEGGRVFVGSASGDPVTFLAGMPVGLGADPAAEGFGSTRFRAETPGLGWRVWEDHTRYFDPGSESLYSIADVAAGDGRLLADHGMTAPHRGGLAGRLSSVLGLPNWSAPWTDPELLRPATTGNFHAPGGGP